MQWVLRRNCSLTPRQLAVAYGALCVVSLAIAGGFWWHGAPAVTLFAGIELLAVAVAGFVYCRHAADRETITIGRDGVSVEHCCGGRVERSRWGSAWLRVEGPAGRDALVELTGEGRRVGVGRYVHAAWRPSLAQELARALRMDWGNRRPADVGGQATATEVQSQ